MAADNWLTEGWDDAFFGDEPYEELSLDEMLSEDFDPGGLGSLWPSVEDSWENVISDAFIDWDDPNNQGFNRFLTDFDFDDPKADWTGGINSLLGGWETDPKTNISFNTGLLDELLGDMSGQDYTDKQNLLFGQTFGTPGVGGTPRAGTSSGGTPKAIKAIEDIFKYLWGGAEEGASGIASGIGRIMDSELGQLALLNYMRNKDKAARNIPMGQQAYGSSEVYGNVGAPDYRVFNIQPALMPGVAYANTPPPTTPPGMKGGGLGDITLAKLEPGEFVVTKKATDNIGAQNLYRMMKQWEGMS